MATGGLMTPDFGVHESRYGPVELPAACEAAHGCGLPVTAHAHGPRGIAESVAAGVDGVEPATLLTTDGVHAVLRTDELASLLLETGAPEEVVGRIEDAVLAAGSPDNYAVVVVDLPAEELSRGRG